MKEILIVLLLIISLFFGLLPREIHDNIFKKIFNRKSPPHIILMISSIMCFTIAICISQEDYFKELYYRSKVVATTGNRIVTATGKLIKSTASNFDSLDDFAETVETMAEEAL